MTGRAGTTVHTSRPDFSEWKVLWAVRVKTQLFGEGQGPSVEGQGWFVGGNLTGEKEGATGMMPDPSPSPSCVRSPAASHWPNPTRAHAWESSRYTSWDPEQVTKHGGRNCKGREHLRPSHKSPDGHLRAVGVLFCENQSSALARPGSAPVPGASVFVPPSCSWRHPWAAWVHVSQCKALLDILP